MAEFGFDKKENCPICGKRPEAWCARLQYGSRELYWIGCKTDPEQLEGGRSNLIAIQNWNRRVARVKYERMGAR